MAEEWLYDSSTDQYYRSDELDPSQYEVVGELDAPSQEVGMYDQLTAAIAPYAKDSLRSAQSLLPGGRYTGSLLEASAAQTASGFGNIIQAAEDFLGTGTGVGQGIVERSGNVMRDAYEQFGVEPGSMGAIAVDAPAAAGSFLMQLGPAAAYRAFPWLLAQLGAQAGAGTYNELREEGVRKPLAAVGGVTSGVVQGAAEQIGLGPATRAGSSIARRVLGTALGEGIEEFVQGGADESIKAAVGGETPTYEELGQTLIRGPIVGTASGALIGAGTHIPMTISERRARAVEDSVTQAQFEDVAEPEPPELPQLQIESEQRLALPAPDWLQEGVIYSDAPYMNLPESKSPLIEAEDAALFRDFFNSGGALNPLDARNIDYRAALREARAQRIPDAVESAQKVKQRDVIRYEAAEDNIRGMTAQIQESVDRALNPRKYEKDYASMKAYSERLASQLKQVSESDKTMLIEGSVDDASQDRTIASAKVEDIDQLEERAAAEGLNVVRQVVPGYGGLPYTDGHVKLQEVVARPKEMQFRSKSDTQGLTVERTIRDPYQTAFQGAYMVWEPENPKSYGLEKGQKYLVVNGHHRLAAALRDNDPKNPFIAPAQILRESDGWTLKKTRAFGAEVNIAEGRAEIADVVRFFRDYAKLQGEAEARSRIKQLGTNENNTTGRVNAKAARIAFGATSNTYTAYLHEQITADQADIIVSIAPNNEAYQQKGVEYAVKKRLEGDSLGFRLGAYIDAAEDNPGILSEREKYLIEVTAEEREKAALQLKAETRAEAAIYASARASDEAIQQAAEAGEVVISDPEQARAKDKAIRKRARDLNKYKTDYLMKQKIAEVAKPNIERRMAEYDAAGVQTDLFGQSNVSGVVQKLIGEETGARRHDLFSGIFKDIFRMNAPDAVMTEEGRAELGAAMGQLEKISQSPSERFFGGKEYHRYLRKAVAAYRQNFIFPRTVAQKHPEFQPAIEAAWDKVRNRDKIVFHLKESLSPLLALNETSQKKVGAYLFDRRLRRLNKQRFTETDTELKKLFSEEEYNAVKAYRQAMKEAWDVTEDTLLKTPPPSLDDEAAGYQRWRKQVADMMREMRSEYYVPLSRFGRYALRIENNKQDRKGYVAHFDKEAERDKEVAKLRKQGFDVKTYELLESPKEEYRELSPELMLILQQIDPDVMTHVGSGYVQQGFPKHFKEARGVPGFSQDIERSTADYVMSLANWASSRIARYQFARAGQQLEPELEMAKVRAAEEGRKLSVEEEVKYSKPNLRKYFNQYRDYNLNHQFEWQWLRQNFFGPWYLTRPLTAAINMSQSVTTTIPQLVVELKGTGKEGGFNAYALGIKSAKRAAEYFTSPKSFEKKHPELFTHIKNAIQDGSLHETATRELSARSRGDRFRTGMGDFLMKMFGAAEAFNRTTALLAALEVQKMKGVSGDVALKAAEKFVIDTQYDYTKVNRPQVARGAKAALFIFRTFQGAYLRQLRNTVEQKEYKATAMMLGHMLALGGLAAFPLARDLEKALEAGGVDIKSAMRERLGRKNEKLADGIWYGLPAMGPFNISQNVAFSELAPGIEQGVAGALIRAVGGVAVDPFQRLGRFWWLNGYDRKWEAYEQLLPPALRKASEAARAIKRGQFLDSRGRPLVDDPTTLELAWTIFGGSPTRLSKAYEGIHAETLAIEKARDNKNINYKIAWALKQQDSAEVNRLMQWAVENGINVSNTAVRGYLLEFLDPRLARLKKAPKKARPDLLRLEKIYGP